jgi:hypothetical protein
MRWPSPSPQDTHFTPASRPRRIVPAIDDSGYPRPPFHPTFLASSFTMDRFPSSFYIRYQNDDPQTPPPDVWYLSGRPAGPGVLSIYISRSSRWIYSGKQLKTGYLIESGGQFFWKLAPIFFKFVTQLAPFFFKFNFILGCCCCCCCYFGVVEWNNWIAEGLAKCLTPSISFSFSRSCVCFSLSLFCVCVCGLHQ